MRGALCRTSTEQRTAPGERIVKVFDTLSDAKAQRSTGFFFDLVLLAAIALTFEGGRFSIRHGRAIVCADSMQYLDGADAILDGESSPVFAFRKPGYAFFLSGISAGLGPEGWKIVLVQHLLHATLALLAYLTARTLGTGRGGAWAAGLMTVAAVGQLVWADRIMSETLYAVLMTGGLLCGLRALRDEAKAARAWWGAGALLALAWMTRSSATAVLAATAATAFVSLRRTPRRALQACTALMLPVTAALVFECGLNLAGAGEFRPCTGTLGPMMLMRTRAMEGQGAPETPAAARCAALLPERRAEDAFRAHPLDVWIARHRAITEARLSEWDADALFRDAALAGIRANPGSYLTTTAILSGAHLARLSSTRLEAALPEVERLPMIAAPNAAGSPSAGDPWYLAWALPHRTRTDAIALSIRLRSFEEQRAAVTSHDPLTTLRYFVMHPLTEGVLQFLRIPGRFLLPPLALAGCWLLGARRKPLVLLAAAGLADALLVGLTGSSLDAVARFQAVWAATDAALAATCLTLAARRVAGVVTLRPAQAPGFIPSVERPIQNPVG
ncbi:MAG: glycosyltransferase family 39 protein [Phycisphaerae bacterium]|nr:MAG: hypothetical protein EDS66_10135 [Planctomycetota bacterium]KAB2945165.1 MAG: hypothetical protein F9K17_10385 [Phycisphaerae bacterium]MBE7456794.1 glycosyltransferase family 39 protein [Planctomycetia bacterium]MCK6464243.1 glycosyltransferase family 39 protein [Phycisphaerae bacterium]MCL4717834.1 glycosyltransferase family 39 protein [Phycisphaerae bacterium]